MAKFDINKECLLTMVKRITLENASLPKKFLIESIHNNQQTLSSNFFKKKINHSHKITRNNPYNRFKLEKKILNKNKCQIKQNERPTKNILTKKILLNKILNRTKSILKSKTDFSEYMGEYNSMIIKPTFKNPEVHTYPLLRKSCSEMISLKNQDKTENNTVKRKILKNFFKNRIMSNSLKEKFKKNLTMNINTNFHKNKKLEEWLQKKKEKDKIFLYEEFFHKWNKDEEENKENNKYSELKYDENKIFFSDYSELIKEKINFCKHNKLENLQKKLNISFEDKNKKKIKLELISMKIIFEPIKDETLINKKETDEYKFEDYKEINISNRINSLNDEFEYYNDDTTEKKNIITLPLSYVFLFYINGLDYFKNILIGAIKFSNDFKNVHFEENEIYSIIRSNKNYNQNLKINSNNSKRINTKDGGKYHFPKRGVTSKMQVSGTVINKQFSSLKSFSNLDKNKEKNVDNTSKENILYATKKKIKVMHSNHDLKNKYLNKKDIKYSEYCFIWETPNKSYKVRIIMPLIIFWSEHIKKNIIIFCDKELFLFLLKNNFVNWDYYILYYLFTFKIFRLIILKGISYYSRYNSKSSYMINLYIKQFMNKINENTNILNINRKIYNHFSDKNESYKFFYTDNFSINSIIEFNSFHIFIENNKLNNKICFEFCLNFKQMIYLININNYENLNFFIPKIIQTNSSEGTLDLDFSVVEYFNAEIFGKLSRNKLNKKDSNISLIEMKNKNFNKKCEWDDLIINIVMPFIIMEQYVKTDLLKNNVKKVELNMNYLNILKNSGSNLWPKKILQLLELKTNNRGVNKSNSDLTKVASKDDMNYETNKRYDVFLQKYNATRRHSKSLYSKLKKSNI